MTIRRQVNAKDSTLGPGERQQSPGLRAERLAATFLEGKGLTILARNYRCRGGEVDLILRAPDGTLIFCEVRARRSRAQGGAAASVGTAKQRALVLAAQHYLRRYASPPPCRFDVVAIDGDHLEWLPGAFDGTG